jgi:DNA helicase-2/ATP-dependent DNA helicase PcrA
VPGSSPKFPQSVRCYLPNFVSDTPSARPPTLIAAARAAAEQWAVGDAAECLAMLLDATCRCVTIMGFEIDGRTVSRSTLTHWLDANNTAIDERLRRFFFTLMNAQRISKDTWAIMTTQYISILASLTGAVSATDALVGFLQYSAPVGAGGAASAGTEIAARARASSIHAAKGETHSATLILECLERSGRKHDVAETLALIATDSKIMLRSVRDAAQLIFVAATRPTHLLAVAVQSSHHEEHLDALRARGWEVHDVTPVVAS